MINVEDYLSTEVFKSRQKIAEETGLSERSVRKKISDLKLIRPVIYNSQTKGYRLARKIESIPVQELQQEIDLVSHCINDIQARKNVFNKQLRTYIAYLKSIEKFLV